MSRRRTLLLLTHVALVSAACSSQDHCARQPWECPEAPDAGPDAADTGVDCVPTKVASDGFPATSQLSEMTELPDPFLFADGTRVQSPEDWTRRRAELVAMIAHYEYGALPPPPTSVSGGLSGGTLTVNVEASCKQASFTAAVTLPAGDGPFPAFIHISAGQPVPSPSTFTNRGYAFIFLDTATIAADSSTRAGAYYTLYPDAETGVLMAWAWGTHRILDVLATLTEIDATRVAVNGFSRWGKAALLAGAFDERIALTVPSSSGLSGTGQFRFFYEDPSNTDTNNEKIGNALSYAGYWYAQRLGEFANRVTALPFDQHEVIDLVAPRPLIATQGKYDYWTNPQGTALSWRAALPVFEYLGASNKLGVAWDDVSHQLTAKHLDYVLDFADLHLKGIQSSRDFHALPADFPDEPDKHPWAAPG